MIVQARSELRIAWVIPKLTAGGIGPVVCYAAEGVARLSGWSTTVLSLHDPLEDRIEPKSGVRYVSLGADVDVPCKLLAWLRANPQEMIITNDVSRAKEAFPHIPKEILHIIQIHDSLRRYRRVALHNHPYADGVVCVAEHIERTLRKGLLAGGFRGVLATVSNGARFPPITSRHSGDPRLRLLFTGQMDAFKGVFDLIPILAGLKKAAVPVALTIVGGSDEMLRKRLEAKRVDELVTWAGRASHEQCYEYAMKSDVLLMLSHREAFGMVTIEAMAMGCVP